LKVIIGIVVFSTSNNLLVRLHHLVLLKPGYSFSMALIVSTTLSQASSTIGSEVAETIISCLSNHQYQASTESVIKDLPIPFHP
jgi:hypothetical protein